ncbi:MAG: PHP domain-containing protein [Candidatus Aenigmarchaeota archaeon]|nr:PHP domain-containing protein [Candidatus Aenigmarchaeota archaeon]
MLFELHCHSWYSKGTKIPWECLSSPKEIMKQAKRLGLSGVALTDHKTTKGWKEAGEEAKKLRLLFIPGVELQAREGHIIALGISEGIDNHLGLEETIERIHEQGGLAIAPHPFDLKGDGIKNNGIEKVDAIEVFNSMNLDKLSNWVAEKKAKDLGKPMVVGSDAHTPEMMGYAVNISGATDLDSLLKEIKKNRLMFRTRYLHLNNLIDWYRERFIRSYVDVLNYIGDNYVYPKAIVARTLLNKFIKSRNVFWDALAHFGLGVSTVYSMLKSVKY